MRSLSFRDLCQEYCEKQKIWGLYISFIDPVDLPCSTAWEELAKAAPYFKDLSIQQKCDGCAFLVFETREEMLECYDKTVGEDGPTKSNAYNGVARVYACAIGPNGALTENT